MLRSHKLCKLFLCITLISSMLLTGCQSNTSSEDSSDATSQTQDYITRTSFKLNTVVTITIYDKQDESILDGALELCDYYEQIFSRTSETAELYQFNHGLLNTSTDGTNSAELSDELIDLLQAGLYYCNLSNGAFDITVAPLAELWNFTGDNPSVPSQEEIDALLPNINYEDVTIDGNTATLANEDVAIDLGAIAKGYIADRIKDYLEEQGVESAMINLGGNVLCVGSKPDGSAYKVGIQKPFADRNETIAVMELSDKSVVSSGIYERYFEEDGKIYHHILNPKTGYPYDNNLVSVTIISDLSVDGDGLSTSCFALGLEDGLALINSLDGVEAVFITDDYELHYSDTFYDNIPITEVESE